MKLPSYGTSTTLFPIKNCLKFQLNQLNQSLVIQSGNIFSKVKNPSNSQPQEKDINMSMFSLRFNINSKYAVTLNKLYSLIIDVFVRSKLLWTKYRL